MPYKEGNVTFYLYGEDDAPAGAGQGAQDYNSIVAEATASGKPFEDPHFPATREALDGISLTYAGGQPMTVKWYRPKEIAQMLFKSDPIFNKEYTEFAVKQGIVGDCWFLAVLADVALEPECMNTLVPPDNAKNGFDSGAFHFRFWCRSKWVDIVIDDRLPCLMDFYGEIRQTLFCKPTADGGFWAPLLEKAYAKMYTKYANISAGQPADAMLDFTGGFIQSYQNPVPNQPGIPNAVGLIRHGLAEKCIIALGTIDHPPRGKESPPDPDNPGNEHVSSEGIVCGHAYSVLGIEDVPLKSDPDQVYTLYKLRNPWGSKVEWSGAFSDKDDTNWATLTKDLRRKTEDKLEDGEFWVWSESIKEYMVVLDICHWGLTYRGNVNIQNKGGAAVFMDVGSFDLKNSGSSVNTAQLRKSSGYYVHLRPIDPDSEGVIKDGLNCNCAMLLDIINLTYTKSGDNPSIKPFGFVLVYSDGESKPDEGEFWRNIHTDPSLFKFEAIDASRRVSEQYVLPAGTVYIAPWTYDGYTAPYMIRIATEGEVKKYP